MIIILITGLDKIENKKTFEFAVPIDFFKRSKVLHWNSLNKKLF